MKNRLAYTIAAVLVAAGTASSTFAAEADQMPMQGMMGSGQQGPMGQYGMMGQHRGMMGQQGPMGQRGMMSCPMMGSGMGGGVMMGSRGVPALPPGNEKLQLQMQAEIMQKVGEILAKYAAQVQVQ